MMRIAAALLLTALALSAPASALPPAIVATTDPPDWLDEATEVPALTEAEYREKEALLTTSPLFPGIRRKPADLPAEARFGFNLGMSRHNASWILAPEPGGNYILYIDLNANSDLTDDPFFPSSREKGDSVFYLHATVKDDKKPGDHYSLEQRLVVRRDETGALRLLRYGSTLRRGWLRVGQQTVRFALRGDRGIYDLPYSQVLLDLDGDGRFGPLESAERYLVAEKTINLGGWSYEFTVDRHGRTLTLKPLPEKRPERPILLPGHAAPDFTFQDVDGRPRKLSDLRGKVVLLDFWSTSCAPCVFEAPKLVELHRRFRDQGFEIVGVVSDDTPEEVRAFTGEKGMTWPQAVQDGSGPISLLYRVLGMPQYYLLDRNGKILTGEMRPGDEMTALLEKQLGMVVR
jgi:peroxiredoxin